MSSKTPEHLWAVISINLNILFQSLTLDEGADTDIPPKLSTVQYIETYTAIYHYCRILPDGPTNRSSERIYKQIDEYLASVATRVGEKIPSTPPDLSVARYLAIYSQYMAGVRVLANLASYLDQDFIRTWTEEGRGWFQYDSHKRSSPTSNVHGEKLASLKLLVLKTEYDLEPDTKQGSAVWNEAVLRAEARSDRSKATVSVRGVGRRAWRVQVAEPLLLEFAGGSFVDAVEQSDHRQEVARRVGESLKEVGIKEEHPARQRLLKLAKQ